LSPSALHRFIGVNLGLMGDPTNLENALVPQSNIPRCDRRGCDPRLGMSQDEVLDANPPRYFERNLRNMVAVAGANGIEVLFSSWAYFPEAVNGEDYMTPAYMQRGVADHNAITERLAGALDVLYVDLAETMPYNADYWIDGLHMTPEGTREQAATYAALLDESGVLPDPDEDNAG